MKWESTKLLNFGIDFGLFNNRITGSVEWYDKRTNDLLFTQPLQSTTGFTGITTNIGRNQNKGVEVTLGADIFKARTENQLGWNVNFVMGYNEAKVLELYGGLKILPSNNSIQVGQPVGVLFTQKFAGVNAATGRPMWYDTLGNLAYQVQARDRVVLGPTALPKFQGGLRNTFTYKGFNLDIFFQYEYGRYATDGQVNFRMRILPVSMHCNMYMIIVGQLLVRLLQYQDLISTVQRISLQVPNQVTGCGSRRIISV